MKNYQYYTTIDDYGLKFRRCDIAATEDKTYRLQELNELGLIFVGSLRLRHQKTDNPVVVAIFEEKNK